MLIYLANLFKVSISLFMSVSAPFIILSMSPGAPGPPIAALNPPPSWSLVAPSIPVMILSIALVEELLVASSSLSTWSAFFPVPPSRAILALETITASLT